MFHTSQQLEYLIHFTVTIYSKVYRVLYLPTQNSALKVNYLSTLEELTGRKSS